MQVTLSSAAGSIDLTGSLRKAYGLRLKRGAKGFGRPPVAPRWFEGAGHGATLRGVRVRARVITLPVSALGPNRDAVAAMLSELMKVTDPYHGEATLALSENSGTGWTSQVVLESGGDYPWDALASAGQRAKLDPLVFKAGDPFWTSTQSSQFVVRAGDPEDEPFLPDLAGLHVTSAAAMGSRLVENPGDAPAYPVWEVHGPGTQFTAIGAKGEVLQWSGTLGAGEQLTFDTKAGTVTDSGGANRYDGLSPAPRFWSIAPGESTVSVVLSGATLDSLVTARWKARRWLIF